MTEEAPATISSDALCAKPEFADYSLWVVPEAQAERALADSIRECAQQLQTPSFSPHMTLLFGITGLSEDAAIAKTKQVADAMSALSTKVRAVTSKDLFFQCVFALLALNEELAEAHRSAKQIFGLLDDAEFMPHISLVYGDLSQTTKQELISELGPRFDGSVLQLDRLQLWTTSEKVSTWELVREFSLRLDPESTTKICSVKK